MDELSIKHGCGTKRGPFLTIEICPGSQGRSRYCLQIWLQSPPKAPKWGPKCLIHFGASGEFRSQIWGQFWAIF